MGNPVERKLSDELIPYFVSADRLKFWPPYWVYIAHKYLNEVFVLLIGLGFSNPVLKFLTKGDGAGANQSFGPNVAGSLPSKLLVVGTLSLVAWGLLKFYIKTTNIETRCTLTQSSRRHFRQLHLQLMRCLSEKDPMPKLTQIQEKVYEIVDRSIVEDAWPYDPVAPHSEDETRNRVDSLVSRFGHNWSVPAEDQLSKGDDQ